MGKYLLLFLINISFVLNTKGQPVTEIAKVGIASTVSIVALDQISQPLGFGSGFIIGDELIATNVHVIEGSNSAYILMNGNEKKYSINGYVSIDKVNDLVILKVEGLHGTQLTLGSEIPPEIGEKIFAVGNPKGLNGTFSEGIISGIRNIQTCQVLQITAPISPGSSGGPVLNSNGRVVGIAFASFTGGQNLNFAVPVKYLYNLKSKMGSLMNLSTVKAPPKTNTNSTVTTPNIKEGVSIRNIEPCFQCSPTMVFFSIKNNLPYIVSDIRILILVYDNTGTVVDYNEKTYFESYASYGKEIGIKPYLAKSIDFNTISDAPPPEVVLKAGYKVKTRILDFKIIEK